MKRPLIPKGKQALKARGIAAIYRVDYKKNRPLDSGATEEYPD
jgi:hypothetical protein